MKKKRCFLACFMLLFLLCFGTVTVQGASFSKKAPVVKVKIQKKNITLTWTKRADISQYRIYQTNASGGDRKLLKTVKSGSVTFNSMRMGKTYYYQVRGLQKKNGKVKYTNYSRVVKAEIAQPKGKSTLKKLLKTALQPVGSTMYVWGGGWNKADTGAGKEACTIGVSPQWEKFFRKQTSSYNYRNTRYQISNGLDCSGYVGWCIYNILNTTNGKKGYVMLAQNMAQNFALRGWGTYKASYQVSNYRAGDIMSSGGHVWIVAGQCKDGSVVILHSSPPGVQLAGTPGRNGNTNSEAVRLASAYMKKYYPEWYKKFPNCSKDSSYLTQYAQMRWDITGNAVMIDPDDYRNKDAGQILKDLFTS
ncbi:MAG: hypothetical protein Q4C59_05945 [Lachnospiraceae bacterium]|nr:hypothetical protein [Lachnospiraceae bacterium]